MTGTGGHDGFIRHARDNIVALQSHLGDIEMEIDRLTQEQSRRDTRHRRDSHGSSVSRRSYRSTSRSTSRSTRRSISRDRRRNVGPSARTQVSSQ